MAGKSFFSGVHRSPSFFRSVILLASLSLIAIIIISFSSSSSRCAPLLSRYPNHTPYPNPNPSPPIYSFVESLDKFLASRHQPPDHIDSVASLEDLDDSIWSGEMERLQGSSPSDLWPGISSVIRVYVYEMPSKFTYDLLSLFRDTYRETDNLTSNGSPVHRLIEQHSIDYWLWSDLISPESQRLLKNVIRVHRQEEADFFYIPFFTTISYFLLEKQQCKALYRVCEWFQGSFKMVRRFMKKAIWLLPDMDSTGNWYKPGEVWLEKDLILPYVANVNACDANCVSENQPRRKSLLFFRGRLKRNAGGKIRSKLVEVLRDAEGVVIEEGSIGVAGKEASQNGMRSSIFCLSPAGDTPSSARLFDAIVSGCIPVIVSDELELPFEGILDYRKIALFVSSSDAIQPDWLVKFLNSIGSKQIRSMQDNLLKYSRHFLYSSPSQPLGPEDLTWRMIAGKMLNIKLHIRRSQRLVEGTRSVCTCDCKHSNATRAS
ncbi:hypothetical protein J5N97_014495 [Dioscorea zingiberensis]|uniref:Exostosin GT47 domain-containing protein n=1 Tax=Dioscorea zingiberensis TaxID=325984 RepID=A0A9D5HJS1_9LILI|nr:hypothetical protein J5N97_014495 [Dioscorea zingiberensis]